MLLNATFNGDEAPEWVLVMVTNLVIVGNSISVTAVLVTKILELAYGIPLI